MTDIIQNGIRMGFIHDNKAYVLQTRAKALLAVQFADIKHTVLLGRVELARQYKEQRFIATAFKRFKMVS